MGGRGSGGSRGGGGGGSLSKKIDTISERVYSTDDITNNYKFYKNLSDKELIQAEKLVRKKFESANKKFDRLELATSNAKASIPKDESGSPDGSSKEYDKYLKLNKQLKEITPKAQYLEVSWKNAQRAIKNRKLK